MESTLPSVLSLSVPSKGCPVPSGKEGARDLVRALSSELSGERRRAFARSFTFITFQTCLERHLPTSLRSSAPEFRPAAINRRAAEAALRFGAELAALSPRQAIQLAGDAYTAALPPQYRRSLGVFYTPLAIVDRLLAMSDRARVDWREARVLDPACGGGAILAGAALRIVAASKGAKPASLLQRIGAGLRGFDVDPFGAWLAQAAVELAVGDVIRAAGTPLPTIVDVRDSLDIDDAEADGFDLVVANPPYGRVTPSKARREYFGRAIYGHANLFGLFQDAALRWARTGGIIAYIAPTSLLSGRYYASLRRLLATEAPPLEVNFVAERAGVFADALQETMLATYRRGGARRAVAVSFLSVDCDGDSALAPGGVFPLPNEFEAPWLLPRVHGQMLIAKRAAHMPHRLRDYGYGVSTGPLVWNRHRAALRRERSGSTHPIVWAECVSKDGVFEWRHGRRNHAPYLETHASHDDLLIARGPCVLVQRTTAPEQPRRLVAAAMPESFVRAHGGVVIENHLNVVRPCRSPSASLGVVAALLNSETVDTVFRCIGGSVAVSAFELEELPLPDSTVIADLEALVAAGAGPTRIEAVIADAYSEETKERIDVVRDWDSGDPGSDEYLMFAPRHRRSKPSG